MKFEAKGDIFIEELHLIYEFGVIRSSASMYKLW